MNIDFYLHALNSTLQAYALKVQQFASIALQAAVELRSDVTVNWQWQSPVEFTALQATLLKVLLVLLLGTGVLIVWSWSVYGQVISEKFVRPSTLKEIEELKLSVAKLKLPKEHSPRI
ncbi:CG42306 [Drosophila busckii]|uniref:CG42306 n=1 Tax=Drosophila busckii TaxID=30019 RepID=A0A0M4EHJ7_DROBS|nr:uncharacterized protein LOC108595105 [Drosophila busckii]ALC42060.1 CG42306 [Drosophila busckii]